jgi:hypothetical protein
MAELQSIRGSLPTESCEKVFLAGGDGHVSADELSRSVAIDRVRVPAAGLLGTGLFTALIGIGLAFWSGRMLVTAAEASSGPQTGSAGGMTWTFTINGPSEKALAWYRVVLVTQIVAVAAGFVTAAGALGMARLRRRPLAIIGSGLAMAPISPGWIAGLPLGIWSLRTLLRPDVAVEFHRPAAGTDNVSNAFSLRQLNRMEVAVLVGCLLGFLATLLPWSSIRVFMIDTVLLGFDSWHGLVTGSVFVAALVAIAVLRAANIGALGRLLATVAAAVTAIVVATIYLWPQSAEFSVTNKQVSGDSFMQPFGDSLVNSLTDTLKDGMGQRYLVGPYVVGAIGVVLLSIAICQAWCMLRVRRTNVISDAVPLSPC